MGHAIVAGGARASVPIGGIKAGDIAVGTVVKLMVNGTATEFLVVNQGIPSSSSLYDSSCDGTWLLMKDCYESRQWHSSNVNNYGASTIHTYLNGTFFNLFGSIEREAIKQVKIPYAPYDGSASVSSGSSGLQTKVFLLGGLETGMNTTSNYIPADGAKLEYFELGTGTSACDKRIAYLNGNAANWWLRSEYTNGSAKAWNVFSSGGHGSLNCSQSYEIRPALIISKTAVFDKNTLILKGAA